MAQNRLKIIQISPKPRQINPNWPKTLKNRPKIAKIVKNLQKPKKPTKIGGFWAVFPGFWAVFGGFSGFWANLD